MAARTIGAIALRPTGNTQGGYFFFSLTTGRVLNRGWWTILPMPNEVIDWVHRMARQEHGNTGLLFEDRNHNPLVDPDDDGEDDSTYHPDEDDNHDDDENGDDDGNDDDNGDDANGALNPPAHHPIADQQAEPNENEIGDEEVGEDEELSANDQDAEHSTNDVVEQMPIVQDNVEVPADDDVPADDNNGSNGDGVHINNDNGIATNPNDPTLLPRVRRALNRLANEGVGPTIYQGRTQSQTQQPGHNMTTTGHLESTTPLPYEHMTNFEKELFHRRIAAVHVPSEIGYDQNETLRHTVLTQYTLKKGLQVFGPPGVEAVYKELQQLHERNVGEPRDASTLSSTQKKNAQGYLMFLKQKRTGQIEGQGCADGRKHRLHTPKDNASSPTVATESVLLSCD